MPSKPASACRKPGCPGQVRDGTCSVCGPRRRQADQQHDAQRGTAAARGYGARWQQLRSRVLSQHPLCADCAKRNVVTAATDVHHIAAKRDGGQDEESNLMALCHACHSKRTAAGE